MRKTYKYKLQPTAEQERALTFVLRRCRERYPAGLQARRAAWQQCGEASPLPASAPNCRRASRHGPDYRNVPAQVLPDVLPRLDRAFQAYLRRVQAGETPGAPRVHGATRYHRFTSQQCGNGATRENDGRVLSKIGRLAVRWSGALERCAGRHTQDRDDQPRSGRLVCLVLRFSGAGVPIRALPATGPETGIDLGLASFATLTDGTLIHPPRC